MCKKLENFVKQGFESLKKENAPSFVLNDYIEEMGTGGATVCDGCQEYDKCFKEIPEQLEDAEET